MFTKDLVRNYVGNPKQLFGIKSYTFDEGREKGVKAFEVDTGAGLRFTVLADRCMDISYAQFEGKSIAHITKTGLVSPAFYDPEGQEWLRSFGGGLLTTCGLMQVGDAGCDGDWQLGLHGRIGNTPASEVCHSEGWRGETYVMELSGKMRESVLYEENLTLERNITARAGENVITIRDTVENEGTHDAALMLLYHMNFGYPLLDGESRLRADFTKTIVWNEAEIWKGRDSKHYTAPCPDGGSALYFHELTPDRQGWAAVELHNPKARFGVKLRYEKAALPCFAQWKNNACQDYVTGLEPGTALPVGRKRNLEQGTFRLLRSGERVEIKLEISVI